jgi:DNA-directed RNA polymerase beta' subunit
MFLMLATSYTRKEKIMEAIHLAQSAIITQQREELDALEGLVIEYQETISNLKTRIHNYYTYGEQP